MDDTFVYDSTDSIIITKKNIERKLPKVTGMYDISKYPIPLNNIVPDKETFELIKLENKQIMDNIEKDIENGTLTKHKAADGQFFGSIPDDVLGVEKKVYINTNAKGSHSLASYVPAGEIATIKLNNEALKYAKKGKLKISVGMTMVNAEDYNYNNNNQNRMPYLGKTFSVNENETQVGTPFGGMIYIDIDDSVPSGLRFEIDVKGVVDTPYYDLGRTTDEEWKESKNAPGLFAEIRTPYLRFMVPSKFIRNINNPYNAALFWTNSVALSSNIMDQQYRIKPMSLIFDQYITAGIAYASVGAWICNLPPEWATSALDYDSIMKSGEWGTIHEINHHYQKRYLNYSDEWGVGDEFSEITNNALSSVSYILYTNIAVYRGEEGTYDWNKVADPYSSLKQQIYEGKQYYPNKPNIGNFMYSTFAHEIGPINFINVVKSTYDGGTFNGIYIPPYDYKLESDGGKSRSDRYDDIAYRLCVASERDYTWYIQNELLWPIKQETINKIKSHKYKETIPVQSVYSMGAVGKETGRPFFIPSTGYVFDFEKSLISPGKVTILDISNPKYGTLTKLPDGKYEYKLNSSIPKNTKDEFTLTVKVEADDIINETKLNCTIGIDYNSSNVEKFNITKWDIHEALEDLKIKQPYATSTSIGMKIYADDGNNLARAKGYFIVDEPREYEFQAFGDDRAVFELNLEDGTTLQSLTEDYSENADSAYKLNKSTNFITKLEANRPYSYTLISNNNGGPGWADVNIRKTSKDSKWQSIKQVYSNLNDVGKITDRTFEMPKPEYVRPHTLASGNETVIKNLKVISTPKGVEPNSDPNSANEGNTNNIVDGDINTYFHSSYNNDKTPLPHEYIFDLGEKKSFNNLEVYTRKTGEAVGVIGNYEIYVSDEYDGDNTTWTKIAEDYTRKGNSNAPSDLKIKLPTTSAKYLKIKALNNRDDYDLTIIAEVKLSTVTNIKNVIAQNSSFIQYKGEWTPKHDGAFVSGGTYNTTTGYFMYCFEGKESNLYVTKDVEVEIRIDGGKWEKVKLTGSLREPSITLNMVKEGKHVIEVRAINQEIALNMISTDGIFYKGKSPVKSDPPIINGANDIEIKVGEVDKFNNNLLKGITVSDDNDIIDPSSIKVTGQVGKPSPGTNEEYQLTYEVKDSDENITVVNRIVTVTNQLPKINGLNEISINKGQTTDLKIGVMASDYEDGDLTDDIIYPEINLSKLDVGIHEIEYKVTDSDGNMITIIRKVIVKATQVETIKATSSAMKAYFNAKGDLYINATFTEKN
ncbi:putative antigenic protein NP1 [Clostridium perfringens D str. JGS1721]|uniref:Putative antigenic protein NP1 n=1 Tax=Clostridium perfringens D str. JGS1721 TaxID=488537 RepID=B1V640_CLOPF|nr:M60 family metallopeptidase [Clostridium perfringens]EDT70736.1 putative antigenic protein NP1 [Clostridium perfringens D str. JGS1721]